MFLRWTGTAGLYSGRDDSDGRATIDGNGRHWRFWVEIGSGRDRYQASGDAPTLGAAKRGAEQTIRNLRSYAAQPFKKPSAKPRLP